MHACIIVEHSHDAGALSCAHQLDHPSAGEGPCLATYFVRRYWQLVLLRVLTGISVGGAFPLVFSLIGDLFSVKQRAKRGGRGAGGHRRGLCSGAGHCRLCG